MKPDCNTCSNTMIGADMLIRCRVNGLECSEENAEGCKKYVDDALDYMLADQVRPWCSK
jgi:hypothetical protein